MFQLLARAAFPATQMLTISVATTTGSAYQHRTSTFRDATEMAGISPPRPSTTASLTGKRL
jgi:hypothetical protein